MRMVQLFLGMQLIPIASSQGRIRMTYHEVWGDTTIDPKVMYIWQGEFPNLRYREIEVIEEAEKIKGEKVDNDNP